MLHWNIFVIVLFFVFIAMMLQSDLFVPITSAISVVSVLLLTYFCLALHLFGNKMIRVNIDNEVKRKLSQKISTIINCVSLRFVSMYILRF